MSRIKMVEINTEMLWRDVKRNGAKLHFVSRAIGRQPGYMRDVFRRGRISVKALNEVSKLLGTDPGKYTATTEVKETPAVAKPETAPAPTEHEAPESKKHQDLTAEERADILRVTGAAGRKDEKLSRINMAFAPAIYDYIYVMSRACGITMTQFTNLAVKEYAKNHEDLYDRVREFRNSL